eukprot:TRINITY_DN43089_c0_g1_i1.p1 TRINITY_DN43089_c0_g1~~TRINITY_DN43089_c0_g1_i1.p1  ORF type:complete len:525 (+),score=73.54 TRINITY_DN43089_c0_g1_i1:69-1643(+)
MLLYDTGSRVRTMFQFSGSILWRMDLLLFSTMSALLTASFIYLIESEPQYLPNIGNQFGAQTLSIVAAFSVVFRTSLSWQRYWEAVSQLHLMYSNLKDVYIQVLAFTMVSVRAAANIDTAEARAKVERLNVFLDTMLQNFSLLSVFLVDRLSHGDTQRMAQRATMASWDKRVVTRRQLYAGEDLTGATALPQLCTDASDQGIHQFATCNAWRGTMYWVECALTEEQITFFEKCTGRPEIVSYWITHDFVQASKDLDVAPPIQSRAYQEMSNVMNLYSQCLKIADVPFPLPFAQLLDVLLLVFVMSGSVYIGFFTRSYYVGPPMAFFVFEGIWGLNELAKTLENPFGANINHISLVDFHTRFIESCKQIKLAHTLKYKEVIQRPDSEKTMQHPESGKPGAETNGLQKKRTAADSSKARPSFDSTSLDAESLQQDETLAAGGILKKLLAASSDANLKTSAPMPEWDPRMGVEPTSQVERHLAKISDYLGGLLTLAESRQSFDGMNQPRTFNPKACTEDDFPMLSRV